MQNSAGLSDTELFERVCSALSNLLNIEMAEPLLLGSCKELDATSKALATDLDARQVFVYAPQSLWDLLQGCWRMLSLRGASDVYNKTMERARTITLARFTRNVVAGIRVNQERVYCCEPAIRSVLYMYSSYQFISDVEEYVTARFLIQTLSNLVTSNATLINEIWHSYLELPEEKNILLRTITHPDHQACGAVLTLIANCISDNNEGMARLVKTKVGHRIIVSILDRMSGHVESEEEGRHDSIFEFGWLIFRNLFLNNFGPCLIEVTKIEGIPITPAQTTLLKLMDSYVIWIQKEKASTSSRSPDNAPITAIYQQVTPSLLQIFTELIIHATKSLEGSLGTTDMADSPLNPSLHAGGQTPEGKSPLLDIDVLLPRVCEAIILTAQCFCTMILRFDGVPGIQQHSRELVNTLCNARVTEEPPVGLLEAIVELLRRLDAFLPRVMFGKVSWSTPRLNAASSQEQSEPQGSEGFKYLKRDLVRLIGILSFENKDVQDRLHSCGGLPVVMNLCVTDERNPYLREHALFALRNLLHENPANQALVREMEPMGFWDENGIFRDSPGVRR